MSAPLNNVAVAERVEGTRRILESDGWEWVIAPDEFGDDEPRIADTHLAPRLGLPLHKLRQLSERYEKAGHVTPKVLRAVRQTSDRASEVSTAMVGTPESHKNRGGRPGKARFYSEADALFLVTRSEASGAIALTKAMIQVVLTIRRHLAATVPVKGHARKLPGTKALPAPAPVQYIPLTTRIATPTRTDDGVPRWEITVRLRETAARMLVDMAARNGWTAEQCAETALMGWTCTAASLGFSPVVQR